VKKLFPGVGPLFKTVYVKTGAYRPPKAGEAFLSGAVPEVHLAARDFLPDARYLIMRPATETEKTCRCCGAKRPLSRTP